MIDTENRDRTPAGTDLPVAHSTGVTSDVEQAVEVFLQSLGDVLLDVTALEVNTMVVDEITGEKFNPWQTYQDIYSISAAYLEQTPIHPSLHQRYLRMRQSLQREYIALASDPSGEFYDPTVLDFVTQEHQRPTQLGEITTTVLPDPFRGDGADDLLRVQQLLKNNRFLRGLRKLGELKGVLDRRNDLLNNQPGDSLNSPNGAIMNKIYAQTVIQLDGDVINRYPKEIVNHPQRDLLLHVHREGVVAGEKQWRGLLEFILNLVQVSRRWRSSTPHE